MLLSEIKDLYPYKSNWQSVIGGNKMHYIDEGSGDPAVLIHGSPGWSFLYRDLISGLKNKMRIVAPDNLGFGLSDKPWDADYSLEMHIDNLEQLLLSLDLKNITLVLHSCGAYIGMGFAVRYPKRIKKIVILNSSAFYQKYFPWRIEILRTPYLDEKLICGFNWMIKMMNASGSVKKLPEKVKIGYSLPYEKYGKRIAILKLLRNFPTNPADNSFEMVLTIEHGLWMFREKPIFIVWGMKDWRFGNKIFKKWKKCYPQAEILELPNAGNYIFEDSGEEAVSEIRDFVLNEE